MQPSFMSYLSRISRPELIDLSVSLAALIIAFSILGERQLPGLEVILISAVGAGSGFLLHELAHKFVAQRYGYWAEYRANWSGLALMIAMSFMGFIFAAPGAVMIRKAAAMTQPYSEMVDSWQLEQKEKREMLWISLAGPMTNLILMALFFVLLLASATAPDRFLVNAAYFAFYINLILAAFNLIPVDPFDGGKIFRASRTVWAIVAIPTILIALPVYFGIGIL